MTLCCATLLAMSKKSLDLGSPRDFLGVSIPNCIKLWEMTQMIFATRCSGFCE